jgi:heme-degrading monooxygenase HmoA
MPFISITRLRIHSIFILPKFMLANEASVKQLRKIDGFLKGKELIDKGLTFWTLTMWRDEIAMKAFRNSIPHRKAMQKLPSWCCEASYFMEYRLTKIITGRKAYQGEKTICQSAGK